MHRPKKPEAPKILESEVLALLSDEAADYPGQSFGEIVRRVLGPEGFSNIPHGEMLERKARAAFNRGRK